MTAHTSTRTIDVNPPSGGYQAVVGSGLLKEIGARTRALIPGTARAFVVFDSGVPRTSLESAVTSLGSVGITPQMVTIKPAERDKSLSTLGHILSELTLSHHERGHPVIALGGGIVGDMAGFAAASYRRGVPWINCPTTLLSMVDASIGGKTAVNIDAGGALRKNMVGAFHQPRLVIADVAVLASQTERGFRAGLAECVKHGLIAADWGDPGLLDWIETQAAAVLAREPRTLIELIARNIALKARVVETDEREEAADDAGGRALLNLGHTFAHAIEPIAALSPTGNPEDAPLQHGEAVALGLIAACAAAAHPEIALADRSLPERVRALLKRLGLPVGVSGLPEDNALLAAMAHDKKVVGGKLRLVLPTNGCKAVVKAEVPPSAVACGWSAIREGA